jgi:hypothetical protein
MMQKFGRLFGGFVGVAVLLGLLGLPGCSSESENVTYVPKVTATRDEIQKAEYERDKAAKASGKTASGRPR